jgi:predicted thioredoxin/glutaredoxin
MPLPPPKFLILKEYSKKLAKKCDLNGIFLIKNGILKIKLEREKKVKSFTQPLLVLFAVPRRGFPVYPLPNGFGVFRAP